LALAFPFGSQAFAGAAPARRIILSETANLRHLTNEILELLAPIPAGSELQLPASAAPVFYRYRDSDGSLKSSTNGFYLGLRLVAVPEAARGDFPPDVIDRINSTSGGIFLSSNDVNTALEPGGKIAPLPSAGVPGEGYLKVFAANGRRHSNPFAARLRRRFGSQFNREIPLASLPPEAQKKWLGIYGQLVALVDRTREMDRQPLFIDSGSPSEDEALAKQYSLDFENSGTIQTFGAWSIATQGTAVRHGFADRPCAEFVSEIIRQAYTKAGYAMKDDFTGDNYLIWSNTAAVTDLAQALYESGWIPWDPLEFKPPVGAIGMNAYADTPGHAYMIAGKNGRFLVDNGSPKGRDLFSTSAKNIENMYNLGAFFLPPGIVPERW
jgi:hypothetical protein